MARRTSRSARQIPAKRAARSGSRRVQVRGSCGPDPRPVRIVRPAPDGKR